MDPEDARRKMREAGIPVGESWSPSTEGTVKSPLIEKQKENLRNLRSVMHKQLSSDMKQVSELQARLTKLKHGGGS